VAITFAKHPMGCVVPARFKMTFTSALLVQSGKHNPLPGLPPFDQHEWGKGNIEFEQIFIFYLT